MIPAYREASYIEKTLHSIEKSVQYSIEKNWIPHVIVVVNNPTNISEAFRKENQLLIQYLLDIKQQLSYPLDVLDYTSPGIQNGVGEARKIGMSFAIGKYLKHPSDLIVSLDADCLVELNYIATLFQIDLKEGGFTFYFEHLLDTPAIAHYELYLRYLRWCHFRAASPFSHYSVGSCLGTNVRTYQKCGGMMPKSATEDFHFLNKVRKIGKIDYITQTTVRPSSRISQRVTLGTGYFLTDAKAGLEKAFEKLMIPHPSDAQKLSKTISIFHNFDGTASMSDQFKAEDIEELYQDLNSRGIVEKVHAIFESTNSKVTYQHRVLEAFDGLETLRTLRNLWIKRNEPMTIEKFLSWANELWQTSAKSAEELLKMVREMEKPPRHLTVPPLRRGE